MSGSKAPRLSLPKMTDRLALSHTGLLVSPFCLGLVYSDETACAAFDVGINFFFLSAVLFSKRIFSVMASGSLPPAYSAVIVGFMALSFQINFTETTFLRSTSFDAVLLVTFLFVVSRNFAEPSSMHASFQDPPDAWLSLPFDGPGHRNRDCRPD